MDKTVKRTPAERFEGLPGWTFAPHETIIDGGPLGELTMVHVDEGPADGPVVLCLHGEPSWSYLYRHMIPVFRDRGARVLAPDLIGFGRSDKPVAREAYSYDGHVAWLAQWFDAQDLHDVTLFCQDWGGLLGLRLAAERAERFSAIVVSNSFLPLGDPPSEAFYAWRAFSQRMDPFDCGVILNGATLTELSDEVRAAYNAPFPDESYLAGARMFPMLVPDSPDSGGVEGNRRAWAVLQAWDKPFLTLFGDSDPVTGGLDEHFHARVPGAAGQPHRRVRAGHFSQEDAGPEMAEATLALMGLGEAAGSQTPMDGAG